MTATGVTVVGSANADLVLPVGRLPLPGETVLASGRRISPGGKGLNQAVAAARAGARTRFVGALGRDAEGGMLRDVLAGADIEVLARDSAEPTGVAVVMVDESGENSIVVVQGANADLRDLTPDQLAAVTGAAVLLVQLEVPLLTVSEVAQAARGAGVMVVLNAAPAADLDDDLLECVDLLVVNEGEARILARSHRDLDDVLDALTIRVATAVVTLGAAGAVARTREGIRHTEPGLAVPVVDTTGAGDTFAGFLAAGLANGAKLDYAMRRATVAAALCVQRPGAVPAVPQGAQVDALLAT